MRPIKYIILLILFANVWNILTAQVKTVGVPFITNYTNEEYNAGNQNFAVIQDDRGLMYFASSAILEFDGTNWKQIYMPNLSYVFSLAKDKKGRIYVGAGNGELGYLGADSVGNLKYISLSDKIPENKRQFTTVSGIEIFNDEVIFLTPFALYIYKDNKFKIIEVQKLEGKLKGNNKFIRPFKLNGHLYIQEHKYAVWEYKNGKLEIIPDGKKLAGTLITGMFPFASNSILAITWNSSPYIYENEHFSEIELAPELKNMYCSASYMSDNYIAGSYTNGIFVTDKKFNIQKHISTSSGLQNNRVFCLYPDKANNLWAGLGVGISHINMSSPYSFFSKEYGLTGTTSSAILFDSTLYISSSTGVHYGKWGTNSAVKQITFKEIKDPRGSPQVWKIDTIANQLLCAGTFGLYYIENYEAKYILEGQAVRTFSRLKQHPNYLIAGGGSGLTVYKQINDKWQFQTNVTNFKQACNRFEEGEDDYIWISNPNKGIYKVKFGSDMDTLSEQKLYDKSKGLPDNIGNYVFKIDNQIVFATNTGIYKYDKNQDRMVYDSTYAPYFNHQKIKYLTQDSKGDIWFKQELSDTKEPNILHWELGQIIRTKDSFEIIKQPFYKIRDNIQSITPVSPNELIIGTEKGFAHYDLSYKKDYNEKFNVLIRNVETIRGDSLIFGGNFYDQDSVLTLIQSNEQIPLLEYDHNGLRFSFSGLYYEDPEKITYKFILIGDEKEVWSDWTNKQEKEFSNLSPGTYTFKVIAKNLYGIESEPAEYKFEILPPWYQSVWAYIGYFILAVFFVWGIVQLSIRRVKLQKENLERVVELRTMEIQQKNEELSSMNAEISRKNKDITSSITYAKRIQDAMLPLKSSISKGLKDYFILFKPRDIVSGDFYWYEQADGKIIITAVDCTGHGVPGAFMSMIGSEVLTTIIGKGITKASEILKKMNSYVSMALKQKETANQDGMDMALCVIDEKNKTVEFAGAKNPLIYISDGKLTHIKGDRKGIGGTNKKAKSEDYQMHTIKYESPTWFYIFTDGFQDQFGGPKNRKFMIKRLKELLLEIHQKPLSEQHQILDDTIMDWMKDTEQTDDILLIGFKL